MTTETPRPPVNPSLVFLLDVDNTLLDNDRLKHDIDSGLRRMVGDQATDRFWEIYEQVRQERDVVDYPLTVQRWAAERQDQTLGSQVRDYLDGLPFRDYLYPHVFEVIDHLKECGTPVILSDGDQVFQRRKIHNSGLDSAVDGNVLIYVHKEAELNDVFDRYPAGRYVVVDDKPRILSALERDCPTEFTTIMVMQGHYAKAGEYAPLPDVEVSSIADLRSFTCAEFVEPRARSGTAPERR